MISRDVEKCRREHAAARERCCEASGRLRPELKRPVMNTSRSRVGTVSMTPKIFLQVALLVGRRMHWSHVGKVLVIDGARNDQSFAFSIATRMVMRMATS